MAQTDGYGPLHISVTRNVAEHDPHIKKGTSGEIRTKHSVLFTPT